MGGTVSQKDALLNLHLDANQLILNYENWSIAQDNEISIENNNITAKNFNLQNGNSQIQIHSDEAPRSPLQINIKDFEIETLTRIIEQDSLLAKGTINGNVVIQNPMNDLRFNADVKVNQLQMYGALVGDLNIQLKESTTNRINTDILLSGQNNHATINGFVDTKSNALNLKANIERLNMESLQAFSFNQIKEGKGYVSGDLDIKGSTSAPQILGQLNFNEVGLFVTQLGTKFQKINDKIVFNSSGIVFDNFTIYDEEGNQMDLDGRVKTKTYQDFAFDLTLNAEQFKIVDAEKSEESMFYGVLAVNTDLVITGDMDLPQVNGNLEIDAPTNFTYIMPQSSPTLKDRQGVVKFVDKSQTTLNQTLKNDTIDTRSRIRGMDVSVNITVKEEAKLSMIVDQASGDFVELQGTAELTGAIDPSGKTSLTGVYQVEDGAYQLNVNFLKRKFDIQKGSNITWTGDPMQANIDITAVYTTETAPIDLLEQQLSGLTSSQMNQYKQRIPFNTLLMMKGDLMKPEITFDITTDKTNPGVPTEVLDNTQTKLAILRTQPNEINKQVFALLLLNRFIGENPFQSNSGLSAESMARQSVSRILSEQLNNLASDLIKGVDINFDLESKDDYSTGEQNNRTDLNVSLSKTLLNDRLTITVGNNFGLEGDARANENMNNIAGDITLNYKLSKDGTYLLRAYRKNQYEVALQGQVIETGVGFIITVDYDRFSELWERDRRRKDKKKNKKTEK